jgi:hypothetical protein
MKSNSAIKITGVHFVNDIFDIIEKMKTQSKDYYKMYGYIKDTLY